MKDKRIFSAAVLSVAACAAFPLSGSTTFPRNPGNVQNVSEFGGAFTVKFETDVSPVTARVQSGGDWLTITETGSDYVTFFATTNSTTGDRLNGSIDICNSALYVHQSRFGSTKWLALPTVEQSIGYTGGTLSFPVEADPSISWEVVSSHPDWLKPGTVSGQGNGKVSYSVEPNAAGAGQRTGTLTVRTKTVSGADVALGTDVGLGMGTSPGTVEVTQDAQGVPRSFSLEADAQRISSSGGTLTFRVIGAESWTVEVSDDSNPNTSVSPDWLTFETITNETGQSESVSYTVQPQNTGGGGHRDATFKVTSGGVTRMMKVKQLSQASGSDNDIGLERASEKVSFAGASGTLRFDVKASWRVEHSDWIAVSPETGIGSGLLTYTVASNGTSAVRTGQITVKSGSVSKTLTITQNRYISVQEALDNEYGYTIEGDWEGQSDDWKYGGHAARVSGVDARLCTTNLTGPGFLTFWWKADGGAAFTLRYDDGVHDPTNLATCASDGWQMYSNSFASVTNVFTWSFAGGGGLAGGLDQVTWTYTPPPVLSRLDVKCDTLTVVGQPSESDWPNFTCDAVFSDGSVKPGVEALWFIPPEIREAYEDISLGDWVILHTNDLANPYLALYGSSPTNIVIQINAVYSEDGITLTNAVSLALFPEGVETVEVAFDVNGGTAWVTNGTYAVGSPYGVLPVPVREGYAFTGWVTQDGEPVTADTAAPAGTNALLTATWEKIEDSGGEDSGGDDPSLATAFTGKAATTYVGWVSRERTVGGATATCAAANVTLKAGKLDRNGNSKITAKVVMAGSKFTLKGVGRVDAGTCSATLTAKGRTPMTVRVRKDTFEGNFGADGVSGYRNVFATKQDALQSRLGLYKGTWTGVFQADATETARRPDGYGSLSVKVAAKGKAKLAGCMPDGTKISVSAQLLVVDTDADYGACVPFYDQMYSGNKGGLGGVLWLGRDGTAMLAEGWALDWKSAAKGKPAFQTLCSFTGSKLAPASGKKVFTLESPDAVPAYGSTPALADLLPTAVSFTVSKGKWVWPKASKVAKDGTADGTNPAGVKLTYAASTGLFKGKFTVYYLVSGKLRKAKAKVQGSVLNGNAYGTAVINGTSLPVRAE